MAPIEFSEEWNASCALRLVTLRVTATTSSSYMAFSWFLIVFLCVTFPLSLLAFGSARRKWAYIRKRSFFSVILMASGGFALTIAGPMRDVVGREVFPCELALWARTLGIIGLVLPVIFKLTAFRDHLMWSQAMSKISFQRLQEIAFEQDENSPGGAGVAPQRSKSNAFRLNFSPPVSAGHVHAANASSTNDDVESLDESGSQRPQSTGGKSGTKAPSSVVDEHLLMKVMYRKSAHYRLFATVLPFLPTLVVGLALQFSYPYYGHACVGCADETVLFVAANAAAGVFLTVMLYSVYVSLKSAPDPLDILFDIKWMAIGGSIPGGPGLIGLIIDNSIDRPYDRGIFSWDWLIILSIIWDFNCLCTAPVIRAYIASRKVSTENSRIELKVLLESPRFQKLFAHHLESEWSFENLRFYNHVTDYRQHFAGFRTSKDANVVAIQTFETYIRPGSMLEINISSHLRERLMEEFKGLSTRSEIINDIQLSSTVFDDAQAEVLELMERDSFGRFKNTKEYRDFAEKNLIAHPDSVVVGSSSMRLVSTGGGGDVY